MTTKYGGAISEIIRPVSAQHFVRIASKWMRIAQAYATISDDMIPVATREGRAKDLAHCMQQMRRATS